MQFCGSTPLNRCAVVSRPVSTVCIFLPILQLSCPYCYCIILAFSGLEWDMSTFLSALEREALGPQKKKRDTPVAEIGHKATKPWDSWAAGMEAGRQYGPLHGKMRKKSATIALKHCITLQKSKQVKLLL